jgi:hypothetical protein
VVGLSRATRGAAFTFERFLALRHLAIAPAGRSNRNAIDELLTRLGRKRELVATVPSFPVAPSLPVNSDVGVTLPKRLVASARDDLVALPLPFPSPGRSMPQAWYGRVRKDPVQAWFRQLVVDVARWRHGARSQRSKERWSTCVLPMPSVPLGLRDGELTLRDGCASTSSTRGALAAVPADARSVIRGYACGDPCPRGEFESRGLARHQCRTLAPCLDLLDSCECAASRSRG